MTAATDNRDKIMEKIQKLLSKAESTTFGPEQEALLEKADKLMVEYAIAQHEIDALLKPGERAKPEMRAIPVCDEGNPIWFQLTDLAHSCATFFDCKAVFSGLHGKGKWPITMKAVGFPESVRAAEQLYTSLKMQLMATINPKYVPGEGDAENIARMKDAGMTWSALYAELQRGGVPWAQAPETRNQLGKCLRLYKKLKADRGEPETKVNPKNFQINFSEGYTSAIESRMYDIKSTRERHMKADSSEQSTSTALVLRSRAEEVAEAYAEMFPNVGRGIAAPNAKGDAAARSAGAAAGRSADLSGAVRNVGGTAGTLSS